MKVDVVGWVVLGLFSLLMAFSGAAYLAGSESMVEGFQHLGYPDYFRPLLGVAKLLGVAALLTPRVPDVLREWAFAGFGFTLIAAAISHGAVGDPPARILAPLVVLLLLATARFLRTQTPHPAPA